MKEKVGLDTILIVIAIIITALLLIFALANKGEKVEDENGGGQSALSQAIEQANDTELFKFNQNLKGFEGSQSGQYLKTLYSKVEESNKNNPNKQVKITGIESADKIDASKTYTVTFSKDQNGYYNAVNVEEKK